MLPLFKLDFDEKEEDAVLEVLRSKWISTGPKTFEFEKEFSQKLDIPYAVAMSNCTAALHVALKITGIERGDEVIVPSLTFVATANAVKFVGATPVFCDIVGATDLTMDPDHLETLITDKTRAIIVMHYAGFSCNMKRIMEIAQKYDLKIIEDASHAPMSEYNGKKLGTIGDIGCFSFFSNKNLSTGEGGMFVTRNAEYFEKAKTMRSHGMSVLSYQKAKGHATEYDVTDLGYNYRMDDLRASLGCVQLKKIEADIQDRKKVRDLYIKHLSGIDEIVVPFFDYIFHSSNYIFPIVLMNSNKEKREKIRINLRESGIETSVHYPAVHKFSLYYQDNNILAHTEYVADNEITLPMYGTLNEKDVMFIADSLKKALLTT